MENNNILSPPATSTRQLYWDGKTRDYSGEISDTHGFGRVYADACDLGMTLFNPKTGNSVVFAVAHMNRDRDGDVLFWTLKPVDRRIECTVTLFND